MNENRSGPGSPYSGMAAAVACAMILLGCVSASRRISSAEPTGPELFVAACAGCHGKDARGGIASIPGERVVAPDLTRIAVRRGVFSDREIFMIVDGQADLRAHGPRNMPVWGYEFFGQDPDDEVAHDQAVARVERLVAYLRAIQRD